MNKKQKEAAELKSFEQRVREHFDWFEEDILLKRDASFVDALITKVCKQVFESNKNQAIKTMTEFATDWAENPREDAVQIIAQMITLL